MRVVVSADDQLGPGVGGVAVDRGELPDRALGATEAADVEAVDPDQLAGPLDVDVRFRLGLAWRFVGGAVAGDEREPLGARVEPVSAQAAPDTVGRDDDPAPLLAAKLGGDPPRAETGVRDRERNDPLLHDRRQLVGHLRAPTLPRSQHLQPVPVDLRLPAVVGRAMDTEGATGMANRGPASKIEQLQPVAEEHVIMRHATQLLSLGGEGARLSCKSDSAPASAGALSRSKPYRPPNCRENSETVQLKRQCRAAGAAYGSLSSASRRLRSVAYPAASAPCSPGAT